MIKKNTYLVRVISSENEPRLEEVSGKEWKQIVSANKNLPKEQRRYFMVSRIPTEGGYDRMYIEIPYEEYKSWKTYHEAEYEYIQHPAETERFKVVDREAYSYEEPVYEQKWSMICWGCGADVGNDQMSNEERDEHMYQHILNGEPDGYHSGYTTVQTGTKTVNVPEESHYETKIIKEAWTEKKLIRAAGWY